MHLVTTIRRLPRVLLASAALLAALAPGANAATLVVTNGNDTGAGSLREAIIAANNLDGNVVVIDSTVSAVELQTSLPTITVSMEIRGAVGHTPTIRRAASAPGDVRFFRFSADNKAFALTRLRLEGGRVTSTSSSPAVGGAVYATGTTSTLAITECAFVDNHAVAANTLANGLSAASVTLRGGAVATYVETDILDTTFTGNGIEGTTRGTNQTAPVTATGGTVMANGELALTRVRITNSTLDAHVVDPVANGLGTGTISGGALHHNTAGADDVTLEDVTIQDARIDASGLFGDVNGGAIALESVGAHAMSKVEITGTRVTLDAGDVTHADVIATGGNARLTANGIAVLDRGVAQWSATSITNSAFDGTMHMLDYDDQADATCDYCPSPWVRGAVFLGRTEAIAPNSGNLSNVTIADTVSTIDATCAIQAGGNTHPRCNGGDVPVFATTGLDLLARDGQFDISFSTIANNDLVTDSAVEYTSHASIQDMIPGPLDVSLAANVVADARVRTQAQHAANASGTMLPDVASILQRPGSGLTSGGGNVLGNLVNDSSVFIAPLVPGVDRFGSLAAPLDPRLEPAVKYTSSPVTVREPMPDSPAVDHVGAVPFSDATGLLTGIDNSDVVDSNGVTDAGAVERRPHVSIADVTTAEGAGASGLSVTADFPVPPGAGLDVLLARTGGTAPAEAVAGFGAATLAAGTTTLPALTLVDDDLPEGSTNAVVSLSTGDTRVRVTGPTAELTIQDDDDAVAGSLADASVNENVGSSSITLSFSRALPAAATFTAAVTTPNGGVGVSPAAIVAPQGATSIAVPFTVTDDAIDEPNVVAGIRVTSTTPWISWTRDTASVTVVDNDDPSSSGGAGSGAGSGAGAGGGAPAVLLVSSRPAAITRATAHTTTFTTVDAARVECSVNGAAPTACSSPYVVRAPRDVAKAYTLRLRPIGADGTPGVDAVVAWRVDRIAPKVARQRPNARTRVRFGSRPVIAAVARDTGTPVRSVASVQLFVDGRRIAPRQVVHVKRTGSIAWRAPKTLARGRHVVRLVVADAAGNRTATTWRFVVR